MPRTPTLEGATTRALTVPLAELARIRSAPRRLHAAEQAHGRAQAALEEAQTRRAELARRLSGAQAEEDSAAAGAEREQTTPRQPAREVSVTPIGNNPNPSGIGLQGPSAYQGVDYSPQPASPALKRYTAAREAVAAIQPLLARMDGEALPAAQAALDRTASDLQSAREDCNRFELAKAEDATPALMAADAAFIAAAQALEAARVHAERVRGDLVQTYGEDHRFSAKRLAEHLSSEVVQLAANHDREAAQRREVEHRLNFASANFGGY